MSLPDLYNCTVAVLGLGYVGLPLCVEIGKRQNCNITKKSMNRRVIGFDTNTSKINNLRNSIDTTKQISEQTLKQLSFIEFENDTIKLSQADVFIVTVPTPIDDSNIPDLSFLQSASNIVGKALKQRAKASQSDAYVIPVIIYESTVYPGVTEEVCVPIVEKASDLKVNSSVQEKAFVCGYSPERINPGDSKRTLRKIVKVTSGSNYESSEWINKFYASIISAGTFKAKSIKVAEAAKVIENTQRDLNIALINELAIIFKHMDIDTLDVLEAAKTKWNFLDFRPGLVGGHCIGVDPYYLTFKSQQLGYYPQVVLAGRRINDKMGSWIIDQLILSMARRSVSIGGANVLVLGLTFKENCNDIRNTKVIDMINALNNYNINVDIVDPIVDCSYAEKEYGLNVKNKIEKNNYYHGVILAVAHDHFISLKEEDWNNLITKNGIFVDVKGVLPRGLKTIRI